MAPTLITGDNTMRVAREEIFGPVITMIPFDDEEEGIAIANDTEFGLYDYVFSKDGARALRVAKRLQAGHVGINTAQRNHDAPFGGFKMSGVGRDGGDYGLLAYTEPQAIIWSLMSPWAMKTGPCESLRPGRSSDLGGAVVRSRAVRR